MKDKWMNMGYEEEDLKPYVEPVQDWNDIKRIEILQVIIIKSREIIFTLVDAKIVEKMCRTIGHKNSPVGEPFLQGCIIRIYLNCWILKLHLFFEKTGQLKYVSKNLFLHIV